MGRYQLRTRNLTAYIAEGTVGADKRRLQHIRSLDALRRRCEEHFAALRSLCPEIPEAILGRSQDPTQQDLYLPSSFSLSQRQDYGLTRLAEKEGGLRIGNAHDHLNALKDALGLRRMLVEAKRTHGRGYHHATRSETSIKRASDVVSRHQHGYRRNWDAMVKLGVKLGPGSPAAGLQKLEDSDVQNLRDFIDNRRFAGNSGDLPWIWRLTGNTVAPNASTAEVRQAIESWEQEGNVASFILGYAVRPLTVIVQCYV